MNDMEKMLQTAIDKAKQFVEGADFNFGLIYQSRYSDTTGEETGYIAWVIRAQKRPNETYWRYEASVGPEETPLAALDLLITKMASELK